ncbi:MAG TPA: hypothetical protein VGK82_04940 [Pyrinomonadaceae bacterium]
MRPERATDTRRRAGSVGPPGLGLLLMGSRGGVLAALALAPGYLLAAPSALKIEPPR